MSVSESEIFDEVCRSMKGHDNWMRLEIATNKERQVILDAMDNYECTVIVFWNKERRNG